MVSMLEQPPRQPGKDCKLAKQLQAIRGMNDILPEQTPVWSWLEANIRHTLSQYGYREMRVPIVEFTNLFARGIGENTDVVEKEMYTFVDRGGDSLTLRPEATACCVRAGIEHGLFHNQQQRLWTSGPMFRYERPQKGRYRQFHQVSVETFGMDGPDVDAELILMTWSLWQRLGLDQHVTLELNTLGDSQARQNYREALIAYLEQHIDALDEDSKRRMYANPLRVLDSKDKSTQAALADAPKLHDYLDEESRSHFATLCTILDDVGVKYTINQRLVRGLDYYNRTVFEWVTTALGSQGTVCGGGRYDGLVEQLGGKPTKACGFAMGMERLVLLLETCNLVPAEVAGLVDAVLVTFGDVGTYGMVLAERLRAACPDLRLLVSCGGGSVKSQMKRADKSGAAIALMVGEDEQREGRVSVKYLREDKPQESLTFAELVAGPLARLIGH